MKFCSIVLPATKKPSLLGGSVVDSQKLFLTVTKSAKRCCSLPEKLQEDTTEE